MNVNELIKTSVALRDEQWESQFLKALPQAKLKVINETPQKGPDGWPYLLAKTEEIDGV